MSSCVVRLLRAFPVALTVAVLASASMAPDVADAQTRTAAEAPRTEPTRGRRADTASTTPPAEECQGDGCEASGAGIGASLRRLEIALRNATKVEPGKSDFAMPTRLSDLDRWGPMGKLIGVLVFFGVAMWGVFNPKGLLVVVLWAFGFMIARYGQNRGHLLAGVAAACAYWWLLHFIGGRAARRWARRRLRPTVYKPS